MVNIYPGAKQVPAHPDNYRTCIPKRATFALVICHITDGHEKAENTAAMFAIPAGAKGGPRRKASAHFVIGQDGTVIQMVDLGDIAYHASAVNSISVGIEHCARTKGEFGPQDPGLPMSAPQLAASARLVAWLCRAAGLPIDRAHIQGHNEASPQDHHDDCPTGQLDWATYIPLVEQAGRNLAANLLRNE